MDILSEVYSKSATENEKNFRFWENYLQSLKSLDFSVYSDKLKVPALVPIGSRISFRGEIKHTNEVTVALGADYFVKCSVKQAEVLRQHRIKDAQSKVDMFNKEKEYLENQMSFTQKAIYDNRGKELIEYYSEEDDKAWRLEHRERVRQYKQNKSKEEKDPREDVTDEELWNRLEELELQEELENELTSMNDDIQHASTTNKKASIQEYLIDEVEDYIKLKNDEAENEKSFQENSVNEKNTIPEKDTKTPEVPSKSDKLQQIIDKQKELENQLFDMKNRKTEAESVSDLLSMLDEFEYMQEMEDELDRLSDMMDDEDFDDEDLDEEETEEDEMDEEDTNETKAHKLARRVSFVDEDDSKTLEITFKHSPIDSDKEPYDPSKGIQKPSDIYNAHSKLFGNGTTSILKKSKYEAMTDKSDITATKDKQRGVQFDTQDEEEPEDIVIKDVVEKVTQADPKLISQARPTSLFKKKRMQMQNKQ